MEIKKFPPSIRLLRGWPSEPFSWTSRIGITSSRLQRIRIRMSIVPKVGLCHIERVALVNASCVSSPVAVCKRRTSPGPLRGVEHGSAYVRRWNKTAVRPGERKNASTGWRLRTETSRRCH